MVNKELLQLLRPMKAERLESIFRPEIRILKGNRSWWEVVTMSYALSKGKLRLIKILTAMMTF